MAAPNPTPIVDALKEVAEGLKAFSKAATEAKEEATKSAGEISKVLGKVSGALGKFSGAAAGANQAANKASLSVQGFGGMLGTVAAGAIKSQIALQFFTHALERAITSLGSQFTKFVQLANPATVIRFNRAMENFISAIGQILTPVLEKLTPIIQQFANAIVSLDEPTRKLLGGLALGSALAGSLSAVVAAIAAVVAVLGGWVTILIALASAVAGMVIMSEDGKKVMESFSGVLKMVGTILQAVAKPISAILLKIGEAVGPLIAAFEPLIEAFGELFAALLELNFQPIQAMLEVFKALMPIASEIIKAVSAVVSIFTILVQTLVQNGVRGLKVVADFLQGPFADAVKEVAAAIAWLVNKLIEMANFFLRQLDLPEIKKFNPDEKKFNPDEKRAQAVVKQASIGDVQSFLKRAYEQSATGSGQTIPQKQLDELGKINQGIRGLAPAINQALAQALKNAGGGGVQGGGGDWGGGVPPVPAPHLNMPDRGDIGRVNRGVAGIAGRNALDTAFPAIPVIRALWRAVF